MALVNRTFEELASFTRPAEASYQAEDGTTQMAAADVPRFEYIGGLPQGMKFGDGDKLTQVLGPWFNAQEGIYVLRAKSILGDRVADLGGMSLEGVDGWKTYVRRWSIESNAPSGPVEVFPDAPNDGIVRYCAGLFDYVLNVEDIDLAIMERLNPLVNWEGW